MDTDIFIASAFFTESDLINQMLDCNCNVFLIIRLGLGTSPDALKKVYKMKNIDIRFFTGTSFHPKFYIFGNRIAYLGSSNLTKSGLTTNQEVNIEIDSEEEELFDQLKKIFNEYWNSAEPLTEDHLSKFENIINQCPKNDPFREINDKIGKFEFDNVGRGKAKGDKNKQFVSNFRKNYQRFITKYKYLSEIYAKQGLRKFPSIPLLIEVDKFLWWIRDKKARGNSYLNVPIKDNKEIERTLVSLINEFYIYSNDYLVNDMVPNYIKIYKEFSNIETIKNMKKEYLLELLFNINAFQDHARYEKGVEIVKENFFKENPEEKVREMICYLLHGKGNYEERLYNCIHDDRYYLKMFGENCKKELLGLINTDDIPIMNGGILKSLEWLGFGKL
jgi:hypothetical protein